MKGVLGFGDVGTWAAIGAESEPPLISYVAGARDGEAACAFIADLAGRLANRAPLTTGGPKAYPRAVEGGFGGKIDSAMPVTIYEGETGPGGAVRCPPGDRAGTRKEVARGSPEWKPIPTGPVERQGLTMRTRVRRFTRLTNALSKKMEGHERAAAPATRSNFERRHRALRPPPAVKAGVGKKLWAVEDRIAPRDRPGVWQVPGRGPLNRPEKKIATQTDPLPLSALPCRGAGRLV